MHSLHPRPHTTEAAEAKGKVLISSIVARKGDVILFHPWNVHSGTTNNRSEARLMMNGMVRLKETEKGKAPANPLLARTLAEVGKRREGMCI